MESKNCDSQENIMPEYNEYLKQSQANPKQSTSNDTNTLTKKRERESEKKEEEKEETNKNILLYSDSEDNGNENMEDSSSSSEPGDLFEAFFENKNEGEDERLENFYDISLNINKKFG